MRFPPIFGSYRVTRETFISSNKHEMPSFPSKHNGCSDHLPDALSRLRAVSMLAVEGREQRPPPRLCLETSAFRKGGDDRHRFA